MSISSTFRSQRLIRASLFHPHSRPHPRSLSPLARTSLTSFTRPLAHASSHPFSTSSTPSFPPYDFADLRTKNIYNIPPLPIPDLPDTIRRYLETVKPHLSASEFAHTEDVAAAFLREHGPGLHAEVLALGSDPDTYPHSYIEALWNDMYLGGRYPLMIHTNPFYVIKDEENPVEMSQTRRAARFISSSMRWWTKVKLGLLEPDMDRDKPMCMSQFGLNFGLARLPHPTMDTVKVYADSTHVVVIVNSQYFKLQIADEEGQPYHPEVVQAGLEEIQRMAEQRVKKDEAELRDVGILTAGDRTKYYEAREELQALSWENREAFSALDECLFVVVLEEGESTELQETSPMMLTGKNGTSRWFDKHQVIVNKAGVLGVNFEHSSADGLTWNRWLHETWHDMHGTSSGFSPLPQGLSAPVQPSVGELVQPVKWELSPKSEANLAEARAAAASEISNLDLKFFRFDHFGRNRIKSWKVSPDAACQMAMQLAYTRMHGKPAPTYEACAMKSYYHGRTETIRSCTLESVAMCDAFLSNADNETKRMKFLEAAATHVKVAQGAKACVGPYQGVDRHLYAMKCIAAQKGLDVPLFNDPAYSYTSTWKMSTSNVTMPIFDIFGFGPVCEDGYGFGYLTGADSLPMCITSFKSHKETSSEQMAANLEQSFMEFNELFE